MVQSIRDLVQSIRTRTTRIDQVRVINQIDQISQVSGDVLNDATTTQLIRSIIENADRLGLVWKLRPGTVASTSATVMQVILDGSTVPIRCVSLLGPMMVGTRVMTVLTPPSGCHVIGMAGISGWASLTPASGWSGDIRYRMVSSPPNAVQLYIRVTPGTKTDGTTLFTLPVGFRPLTAGTDVAVAVSSMAGATAQSPHLNVPSTGVVTIWGCANANGINLDTLFTVDNAGL